MLLALILFTATALGGATLLTLRLLGRELPMGLALMHGSLGLIGLIVLTVQVFGGIAPGALASAALALLSMAGFGGGVVFALHVRRLEVPLPLTLTHAVIAAAGVICLLLHVIER